MKSFLLLGSACLCFLLSSCPTLAQEHYITRPLPSGLTVQILQVGPVVYTNVNKDKTLALSYLSNFSLDNKASLAKEVGAIWVVFRSDVEKDGYTSAVIFAQEPSKGEFIKQIRQKGFAFFKNSSGEWYCRNDRAITMADALYRKMISAAQRGQHPQAIKALNELVVLWPNSAEAYANRGAFYLALHQAKKGLADIEKSITLNPNNAVTYNNRGAVYAELGYQEKALADFNKALALNPKLAEAYMNRGEFRLKSGKADDAVKDLSLAINLSPNLGEAFFYRAEAYKKLGKLTEAGKDLEVSKALNYHKGTNTVTLRPK